MNEEITIKPFDDREYAGHHPNATKPYSYTKYKQLLRMPISKKIMWSHNLISSSLNGNPVVAFSGGKSSEVMLHMVLKHRKIPVVYNDTGVNEPGTTRFVKRLADEWNFDLIITKPKITFWEIVDKYGFPKNRSAGKGVPKCCMWLKEYPMRDVVKEYGFDTIFIGNQANESMNRRLVFMNYGESYYTKKIYGMPIKKVFPVAIWTDYDIWRYIEKFNLPYHPLYDKLKELPIELQRLGCSVCTAYKNWERKMRKLHPRMYFFIKKRLENGTYKRLDKQTQ